MALSSQPNIMFAQQRNQPMVPILQEPLSPEPSPLAMSYHFTGEP